MFATSWTYRYYFIVGIFNMQTKLMILCDSLKCYTLWGVTLITRYDKIRLSIVLYIWWIDDTMRTELLMLLYKQWGITHYIFDVIVLTLLKKSFSWLHHRIFLILFFKYSNCNFKQILIISKHVIQKYFFKHLGFISSLIIVITETPMCILSEVQLDRV